MMRGFLIALLAGAIGCLTLGSASAEAATEIGRGCDPDVGMASAGTALQASRETPPNALKTTAPGVVTSWKVQSAPWLEPRIMALKVFRQVGGEYEAVAESESGSVLDRADNVFATRIPVGAGVMFGVKSSKSFPACEDVAAGGDTVALLGPDVPVGGKAKPTETRVGYLLSLAVVVEPDADGDGYGDETQDKCPQSAATQGACPAPPPNGDAGGAASFKLKGKPKLEGNVVAVKLTTSARTTLTVIGSIRGKRAAKPVTKTISPGEVGRIYLQLTKKVKQRLANLPLERKLRMVIEVKAAGVPTASTEIALHGRKKPRR